MTEQPARRITRAVSTIDGEGVDINGRHNYCLLVYYDGMAHVARELVATGPDYRLTSDQCLDFLLTCAERQRTHIIAGYSVNYDITKWLSDLHPTQLTALRRSGWVVWESDTRYYYIEYVPSHSFFCGELPPGAIIEQKVDSHTAYNWGRAYPNCRFIRVEDVYPFAQSSFVHMLREWQLTVADTLQTIIDNKEQRGTFQPADMASIRRYCRMECIYLADYVRALQAACIAEGLRLTGWYGPGAIARALMVKHGTKKRLATSKEPWIKDAAIAAYYGGRIEHYRVGRVPLVYNYDIQSAYPHALAQLPDLARGVWRSTNTYDPTARYALWRVSWSLADDRAILPPFPWRRQGRIFYPLTGEGWYHAPLVDVAQRLYGNRVSIRDGYVYESEQGAPGPFAFVPEIAAKRLGYKQTNDPRHRVLKLGLNSLYGKTAQHQSEPDVLPPFQCYYAAGYATAATQARLLEMIYQTGHDARDVIATATDGLYTQTPRDITGQDGLGSWELSGVYHDLYTIQPGVAIAPPGPDGTPHLKRTRGFGAKHLDYDRIHAAWAVAGPMASYEYTERRFVGIGACSGHDDYTDYGQWIEQSRIVSFWPDRDIDWSSSADGSSYAIVPLVGGGLSDPYVPPAPNAPEYADGILERLSAEWVRCDQPA